MDLVNLLKYALKVDIQGQLYYDFNEHSLERLKALALGDHYFQTAIENNLITRNLFGTSYLVPAEIVNRNVDRMVK